MTLNLQILKFQKFDCQKSLIAQKNNINKAYLQDIKTKYVQKS